MQIKKIISAASKTAGDLFGSIEKKVECGDITNWDTEFWSLNLRYFTFVLHKISTEVMFFNRVLERS
jgi:hypothetical protein